MITMDVDSGVHNELRKSELQAAIKVAEDQLQVAENKLMELTNAGFTPTKELENQKIFEERLSLREAYIAAFNDANKQDLEGTDLLAFLEEKFGSGISRKTPIDEQIRYFYEDLARVEEEIKTLESQGYEARSADQKAYDELPSLIAFLQNHRTLLKKELDAL